MSFKTTFRLLVVACILVSAVWFAENRSGVGEPAGTGEKVLRPDTVSEVIRSLSVEHGEFAVDCARRGGKWFIDRPLRARADEGEISRILNVLELLRRDEIITAAERANRSLSLQDYGLSAATLRAVLQGTADQLQRERKRRPKRLTGSTILTLLRLRAPLTRLVTRLMVILDTEPKPRPAGSDDVLAMRSPEPEQRHMVEDLPGRDDHSTYWVTFTQDLNFARPRAERTDFGGIGSGLQ